MKKLNLVVCSNGDIDVSFIKNGQKGYATLENMAYSEFRNGKVQTMNKGVKEYHEYLGPDLDQSEKEQLKRIAESKESITKVRI